MAKCPICSTHVEDTRFLEKYVSSFNNQEYKLYHCPNCDLQWWEPLKMIPEFYEIPNELRLKYQKGLSKIEFYQQPFF